MRTIEEIDASILNLSQQRVALVRSHGPSALPSGHAPSNIRPTTSHKARIKEGFDEPEMHFWTAGYGWQIIVLNRQECQTLSDDLVRTLHSS